MRRTTSMARCVRGSSAQSAAADFVERLLIGFETFARESTVHGHDAVQRRRKHQVGHFVDKRVRQVGRYFQQDRPVLVLAAAKIEERLQNIHQVGFVVRYAAVRTVVAADVDRKIIDVLVEVAEHFEVVGRDLRRLCQRVFADVASDDEPVVPVAELGDGLVQPLVVEARTVDDRPVCGQPEDAGSGIAGLGLGRDRTDLDESEAQGRKFAERFSVAVETRRQTDRVGKPKSEYLPFERRVLGAVHGTQQRSSARDFPDHAQQEQDRAVGTLDVHGEQDGFDQFTIHNGRCGRFRPQS